MPKIHGDNRMRMSKTLSLDMRIFESAQANNMHPSRFIEWLYSQAKKQDIPDDMTLEQKQAKLDELNLTARALNAVIAEEKKQAEQMIKAEAQVELDKQRNAQDEADRAAASKWYYTLSVDDRAIIGIKSSDIVKAWKQKVK